MCVIVDTNCLASVFERKSEKHPQFAPVLEWIIYGKGKLIYGGSKYISELRKASKYFKIINQLKKKGKVICVDKERVDREQKRIEKEITDKDLRKIMELNYFAPLELSMEILPVLKKNNGSLVQICSIASLMPLCCMSTYSSSKSALLMFNESLRMETDVHLLSVMPGRIDTGFSSRAVKMRECPDTPGNRSSSPDKLADKVFNAVLKRRKTLIYPAWYKFVVFVSRLFPALTRKVSRRIWELDK